ncbi:MAG TPA: thioredoxin-dependent thiol peroxidase [Terriglobales bacterium]|nr:thioredoxin-dependent thiol peroxidase [Terriglobales bacterium]
MKSAASAAYSLPEVGQLAPDFDLPSTTGHHISLAQYLGKKTVILYFYPKDETPGCTKEACDFRDHSAQLQQAGVVILGVSNDDLTLHADFRHKERIPFPLLSDTDARVSKLYGVYGAQSHKGHTWTGISRTTFVIDKDGRIEQVWPKVNVDGHVDEVLSFVSRHQPNGT